jgi:hypothetical protein
MMWVGEATKPFHTAPGEFHTRLFDHVNGCGMEMGCTRPGRFLAKTFFGQRIFSRREADEGKNGDSAGDVLHIA